MKITSFLSGAVRGLTSGIRSFSSSLFSRHTDRNWVMAASTRDWRLDVGDGSSSSTVMAPVLWVARTFPEAPLALWKDVNSPAGENRVADHGLLRLVRRPNEFYSGVILWMATITDYFIDGNAYWLKLRDRGGRVVKLYWAPSFMMKPVGSDTEFVTHYEYNPNGTTVAIKPEDVVHFRFGLDSDNPRLGRSPLKSVLREVYTDDEAASFTAALLRNMGVPGLLVAPDGDYVPSQDDADEAKATLKAQFTGEKRGEPLVMSGPTKITQFGFSPDQMNLKDLRRIPEERVSAVLGVPAIVAGLGAGLDRSTFTNFAEAREAAYEQTIIPTQNTLAEDVWFQLLPDFERGDKWNMRVGFDLKRVRVLQGDELDRARKWEILMRVGAATRAEAKKDMEMEVRPGDDVYLLPSSTVEVPADGRGEPRVFFDNGSTNGSSGNGSVKFDLAGAKTNGDGGEPQ